MVKLVGRQLHLQSMKVNKINRPNTTSMVRGICTIAVYFSVFRPRFVASLLFMRGISVDRNFRCYHNLPCVSVLFWLISVARYVFKSPSICF